MTVFDQDHAACRCDWGVPGHDALAPADVVIDVLSFSTCVDIAVGRGAAIFPHRRGLHTRRSAGSADAMNISIRDATPSDAGAIAQLTGQLGYDVSSADATARLGRIVSRPDQRFLIAEVDGQPAAWLHAARAEYIETEPFVMIAGLVVDRRYRRRGIGAALLRQAEQWAIEQGCTLVRLWSSASRVATHQFYEHRGFTSVKTQVAFVKPVGGAQPELQKLVPRVEEQS